MVGRPGAKPTDGYPPHMVSDRDRAKMCRLSRDLAAGETDDPGTPEQRRSILEHIQSGDLFVRECDFRRLFRIGAKTDVLKCRENKQTTNQ